jgi:hypothetical protein
MGLAATTQEDSSVQVTDLAPYLGRRCQLMVQCSACGQTHVHEGTLGVTARPGEVEIVGQVYEFTQVRALVLAHGDGEPPRAVSRSFFNVVLGSGLVLALLTALRVLGG